MNNEITVLLTPRWWLIPVATVIVFFGFKPPHWLMKAGLKTEHLKSVQVNGT